MTQNDAIFYVYAHFDSVGKCFYIGKGKQQRAYSTYRRNVYWNRVAKRGYTVSILFDALLESDALALEVDLIAKYSPRTNLTKGGVGGCTVTEATKPQMIKKVSEKRKLWWATKTAAERKYITRNSGIGPKKYWATFTPEELSIEQKRRNSFRKLKKVICLDNNIIYDSARQACEALGIKYSNKVSAACIGSRPHYRGYKFKYV